LLPAAEKQLSGRRVFDAEQRTDRRPVRFSRGRRSQNKKFTKIHVLKLCKKAESKLLRVLNADVQIFIPNLCRNFHNGIIQKESEMSAMEWLLIAATLAAFGFVYWLIHRMGTLFDRTHPQAAPSAAQDAEIVVYGNSAYELEAEHALRERGLSFCRAVSVRELLEIRGCRYLLALSDREAENLVACELGGQVVQIPIRIALCRPGAFEPEFEDRDTRHFAPDLFRPSQLAALLDGKSRGNLA
jgi:hypothetical protein